MVTRCVEFLTDLARDEQGVSFLEVVLLAILIGLAAFAGMGLLGETAAPPENKISTAVN